MSKRIPIPIPGEYIEQPLPVRNGLPKSVHLIDHRSALVINAALDSERPLLVRGEPGVGKSQLARAAAELLDRALVTHTVNSHTETDALLWEADLVARLAEAQLGKAAREDLALGNFIRPGALWWGLDWHGATTQLARYATTLGGAGEDAAPPDEYHPGGTVVLVDEIDKADSAVPNGLLDALGHNGFDVPGLPRVTRPEGQPVPLVVFTTNEERHLPEAFLRRCFVLNMELGTGDALVADLARRGHAHNDAVPLGLAADVIEKAAVMIAADRQGADSAGRYRPGVAEYLDLLKAVRTSEDPVGLLGQLSEFVVKKQGRVG